LTARQFELASKTAQIPLVTPVSILYPVAILLDRYQLIHFSLVAKLATRMIWAVVMLGSFDDRKAHCCVDWMASIPLRLWTNRQLHLQVHPLFTMLFKSI
jgi:hypothetical protein